jgi:hypothetical protein
MPQVSLGPRRRAWLLVAGQLAMLVCAMAFSLVHLGADARVPALAAARPLAAGQTITVDDLQVVRIVPDAGMALLPAGEASRVVGSSVAVPVAAGTLLSEAQLGPAQWPPRGRLWRRCRSSRVGCRPGWLREARDLGIRPEALRTWLRRDVADPWRAGRPAVHGRDGAHPQDGQGLRGQ